MDLESIFLSLSFSLGALALGVWILLGIYWYRKTTGVLKVSLIWLSLYMSGTLGLRIYMQVYNYNNEAFDALLTPIRMVLNIAVLGLGLYLARYSGKINQEGELSDERESRTI